MGKGYTVSNLVRDKAAEEGAGIASSLKTNQLL
jgi:hypothetical protein